MGTARHSDRKCPCLPHLRQTRDGPHPLNAVRAAAADVAADTSGTAVAAPAADIAADARAAALADAALMLLLLRLMRWLLLSADAAADVAAAFGSAGDLYRRACCVPPPLWPSRPPLHPPLLALKPAARAWLPLVPSELLLSSSTRTRPPSSSARLKSVFNATYLFSGAYEGGRPFKTRRLISYCSVTSIS